MSTLLTLAKGGAFLLDIGIVYLAIYLLILWVKDTQAVSVIKGVALVFGIYVVSQVLGLTTLHWLLEKFTPILILLTVIIFQPELRRLFDNLGSGSLFSPLKGSKEKQKVGVIRPLIRAIDSLSKDKIGALIVLEQNISLADYSDSGIQVNGTLSQELLTTLFWPSTPTHDGAVVIQNKTIKAASCFLPLTETIIKDYHLGTRHRAALGLSEVTDALVIVVSEESGSLSMAENGIFLRNLNLSDVEKRLFRFYNEEGAKSQSTLVTKVLERMKG